MIIMILVHDEICTGSSFVTGTAMLPWKQQVVCLAYAPYER